MAVAGPQQASAPAPAPEDAAKNIVLLSDGTGNSAAKVWRTNVWRVYRSLDLADPNQLAVYDDGVGTSSFKPLAYLGGAFGWGLKRNVIHLYAFLCRHYTQEANIYCFGFSRGAFTIRILADLVANEGLIDPTGLSDRELRRQAKLIFQAAQMKSDLRRVRLWWPHVLLLRMLRYAIVTIFSWVINIFSGILSNILRGIVGSVSRRAAPYEVKIGQRPSIRFVGVWDTVGAYGLPVEEMTRGVDLYFWPLSMRNQRASEKIGRLCHALALDDKRTTFHPLLWDERQEENVFRQDKRERQEENVFGQDRRERQEENVFGQDRRERQEENVFGQDRRERQEENVFGQDRRERQEENVFGQDRRERQEENVFGQDRRERQEENVFGQDRRERQEENVFGQDRRERQEENVFGQDRRERQEENVFGQDKRLTYVDEERISQVWFAGVHANVGGGYPDDGMAYVPLDWMLGEAEKCGLRLKRLAVTDAGDSLTTTSFCTTARHHIQMTADPSGRIYNSRSGLASYYRYGPRRLDQLISDKLIHGVVVDWPKIHESVFDRIKVGATNYAPFVLPQTYAVVKKSGLIIDTTNSDHPEKSEQPSPPRLWRQERIWNLVWHRRVTYFATLGATLFLASAAIIDDNVRHYLSRLDAHLRENVWPAILWPLDWGANAASCLTGLGPWLVQKISSAAMILPDTVHDAGAWVVTKFSAAADALVPPSVEIAKSTLPSFLGSRLDVYGTEPVWTATWLLIIGLLMLRGSRIEDKIDAGMRQIWERINAKEIETSTESWNLLCMMRMSPVYGWTIILMKHYIMPTMFAYVVLLLALGAIFGAWQLL